MWRGAITTLNYTDGSGRPPLSQITTDEVTFWSVTGQKLGIYSFMTAGGNSEANNWNNPFYSANPPSGSLAYSLSNTNYYFGGKLIKNASGWVNTDRLGSIGKYYPYGQEKPSATTNGTEKFTGYVRDAETGLDYADQRYHQPGVGRFMTPDPYMAGSGSGDVNDPGSWNRYNYVDSDPVNATDPSGLYLCATCARQGKPDDGTDNGADQSGPTFGGAWRGGLTGCGIFDTTIPHLGKIGSNPFPCRESPGGTSSTPRKIQPPPPCPTPTNDYQSTDEQFVTANWGAAQQIAATTGLPAGFILAWASIESYNTASDGLGPAATLNNNWFGLTYSNPSSQNVWQNEITCPEGSYDGIAGPRGHACFAAANSFFISGMSALLSQNSRYLNAALAGNDGSYADIGQAIANAGFNANPGYGAAIASRSRRLSAYMGCVQ